MSEEQPETAGTPSEGPVPSETGPGAAPRGAAPVKAPRPPRTTNGLIGALVATLLAIGVFLALSSLSGNDLEIEPEAVDYRAAASAVHDAGTQVVYPRRLPAGWIATSVDYVPGDRGGWGIGMLTDAGDFVGIRQEDAPLDDLLATYVDEQTTAGDRIEVDGSLAPSWREYADDGGDHAYAGELGADELLVYGSAPTAQLRQVLELLTDQKP